MQKIIKCHFCWHFNLTCCALISLLKRKQSRIGFFVMGPSKSKQELYFYLNSYKTISHLKRKTTSFLILCDVVQDGVIYR